MAEQLFTTKQRFELSELRTVGGATIRNVAIGYETYGALNAARDNAILVAHYFSGTSHAAGRYRPEDPLPGYWDAIIGPGKAVDTNRYFVISSDTLVNLNANDPDVISTGPASRDPATGKPYGLSFPAVAIADFVRAQKALVESLGVTRLRAVMGPSMGGLQTFEWAASYPEAVERIIPAISTPHFTGWLTAWLSIWTQPIRLDPNWRGGAFYDGAPPSAGLEAAMRAMTLHALQSAWADGAGGRALAAGANSADIAALPFAIEKTLEEAVRARSPFGDANHMLYLARANQTFIPGAGAGARSVAEGVARIKAPTLLIHAPDDLVFLPEWVETTEAALRSQGVAVETAKLSGPYGHYNGVMQIAQAADRIADFLARPI
ncbi:homoserine O-acetyltransferase [Rhodoblastus acidophilus]|uniref:Probable acyltransferase n=1 Tax=Candidatus Rhodoblastus alkanivorans TaxID=2954117 RepID=A0ABS9Z5U1_9HYPH|nr:homoserine O-acetyltransferase [Candidatus Rhodoblastus alkanivorans]MCI4677277.1 homoserine O-acetyltransferase [Candidatus Rhodoblastus alkanivorans]MCI4682012.1 homoserine O-acetyltransferase [Candidatus Rhodoblastus alkanivorans]MDI4643063.1 homoserine O-acetyltransferase [Rhodoblastus acidophilus]